MQDLNHTVNKSDRIKICGSPHPLRTKLLPRSFHILDHKTSLNKFKEHETYKL